MVVKIILFFLVLGLVMSNASGIMRMMHESASLKKNLHLYKKVQLNIRSIFFWKMSRMTGGKVGAILIPLAE